MDGGDECGRDSSSSSSSRRRRIPERACRPVQCCCGSAACAFLSHSQAAVAALERDVCAASRVGQALLVRHEAYMADSERERQAMAAQVAALAAEKQALEAQNATLTDENGRLLDQLEALNGAVAEADTQTAHLQATLRTTQQELHHLAQLAARTERLEQQIADFEREQAEWQAALDEKDEAEKSARRRWHEAQRTLAGLQQQMDHIEHEAQEERERHADVVARMERRQAVERELHHAAARSTGAAAAPGANGVVSHFVKDILQDNANLQMGIVELRDMLQRSNGEVESLRAQLSLHQPPVDAVDVAPPAPPAPPAPSPGRPTLHEELRAAAAQELHVHHHYHAPPSPAPKMPHGRPRPKKKRHGALTPAHFTPPVSGIGGHPRYSFASSSNAAAILSHTAASLPDHATPSHRRWSLQSHVTYQSLHDSSGPSSPRSTNRASSMFDRGFSDTGQDSSRPTTPDTEDPSSPMVVPVHSKRSSRASFHSRHPSAASHRMRPSLNSIVDVRTDEPRHGEQPPSSEPPILEEDEHEWENTDSLPPDEPLDAPSPLDRDTPRALARPRTTLRRATSHESVLSCAGMDVHTLKSRPSQLLAPYCGRAFSSQAVVSDEMAHAARPAAISRPSHSGRSILSGMSGQPTPRPAIGGRPGIGSRVGGWMLGKWGATPTPSTATAPATTTPNMSRSVSTTSSTTGHSVEDATAPPKRPKYRPPGVNNSGPIPGFGPEPKLQHSPIMQRLDASALKNALEQ